MSKPDNIPQRVWDEAIAARSEVLSNIIAWISDGFSDEALTAQTIDLVIARAILAAEQRERERAAKIVDDECTRVLGKQDGTDTDVDRNIRMVAILLPDIATAIRNRSGE